MPVIEYARELGAGEEQLDRALLISNLTAIHLKEGIGRLSAYCGAVSAGTGAGAGIAYLLGGGYEEIMPYGGQYPWPMYQASCATAPRHPARPK